MSFFSNVSQDHFSIGGTNIWATCLRKPSKDTDARGSSLFTEGNNEEGLSTRGMQEETRVSFSKKGDEVLNL
jgi:hypothetical protein